MAVDDLGHVSLCQDSEEEQTCASLLELAVSKGYCRLNMEFIARKIPYELVFDEQVRDSIELPRRLLRYAPQIWVTEHLNNENITTNACNKLG